MTDLILLNVNTIKGFVSFRCQTVEIGDFAYDEALKDRLLNDIETIELRQGTRQLRFDHFNPTGEKLSARMKASAKRRLRIKTKGPSSVYKRKSDAEL